MSRITRTFDRLRKRGQSALIPFIMTGDPDVKTTESLVQGMAEAGADIIELGVPFSDPIADGPTIQAASQRALQNGISLNEVLHMSERLSGLDTPLVLMTYFNPIFRYGLRDFAESCMRSGVDGVIVPDLPPEEAGPWISEARRASLDTIFLIAPTSPFERIRLVSRYSRGFIYYVSVTGVTGARESLPDELESAVNKVKVQSKKPVAVGFGISTPEQAKRIGLFADGVIVGSAIVKMIEGSLGQPELITKVKDFVSSFAKALKS